MPEDDESTQPAQTGFDDRVQDGGQIHDGSNSVYFNKTQRRNEDSDFKFENKDDRKIREKGSHLFLEQQRVVEKCCPMGEILVLDDPPSCLGTGSAPFNFSGAVNEAFCNSIRFSMDYIFMYGMVQCTKVYCK